MTTIDRSYHPHKTAHGIAAFALHIYEERGCKYPPMINPGESIRAYDVRFVAWSKRKAESARLFYALTHLGQMGPKLDFLVDWDLDLA